MGLAIFTKSGTFNPATYGLRVGQLLQIVCVGGGNSGQGGTGGSSSSMRGVGGAAGNGGGSSSNENGGDSGLGYGAGGGGGASSTGKGGAGGAAGAVVFGEYVLTSLTPIAVTVGNGGSTSSAPDSSSYGPINVGGDSSFGNYIVAKGGGGAPGGNGGTSCGGGGGGGYIVGSSVWGGGGGHGGSLYDADTVLPGSAEEHTKGRLNGGNGGANMIGAIKKSDGRSGGIGSGVVVVTW